MYQEIDQGSRKYIVWGMSFNTHVPGHHNNVIRVNEVFINLEAFIRMMQF